MGWKERGKLIIYSCTESFWNKKRRIRRMRSTRRGLDCEEAAWRGEDSEEDEKMVRKRDGV